MEKLDLSRIKTFSSEWPHEVRLAVCIATKYAHQRLCERARETPISIITTTAGDEHDRLSTPHRQRSHEEEGVELREDGRSSSATGDAMPLIEEKKRKELVASWEEFASKFLTATCQHLGIAEEALPPGPLLFSEILEIGQGKPSQLASPTGLRAEERALYLEAEGQETGGAFARTFPSLVLRSDVEQRRVSKAAEEGHVSRMDENCVQDHETERNEVPADETAHTPKVAAIGQGDSNVVASDSVDVRALHLPRLGGALNNDASSNWDIEIYNELLLVALGLGQYRSVEDGATMVFENEAMFEDELLAGGSTSKFSKVSITSHSTPDPSPAGVQLELAYQQQQRMPSSASPPSSASSVPTPWKSFSKWADQSVKNVGNLFPPTAPARAQLGIDTDSPTPSAGSTSSRDKARQQPSEFCHYDARARAMLFVAANALGLSSTDGHAAEKIVAQTIYFIMKDARATAAKQGKDPLKPIATGGTAEDENSSGRTGWMNRAGSNVVEEHGRSNWKRWAAAGGGAAIGAGIIGLTGGLAAPIVLPALASLSGGALFASSGGIVLAAALFGIGGGGLAGYRVSRRLRGLESFEFHEVETPASLAGVSIPSLHATICMSGIIFEEHQQIGSWQGVWASSNASDVYIVSSEAKLMSEAGVELRGYVFSYLKKTLGQKAAEQAMKRTALAAFTALTLPLTVANVFGSALDSTFVRAKSKAFKQGLVLAEVLRAEVQGHRPVVLIGASLGCVSILTALNELAKDPEATCHLVDSVYLICAPVTTGRKTLTRARSVVARRMVNAFSTKDMVCSVAAWLGMDLSAEEIAEGRAPKVLGSGPTWGVPGLENIDVSDLVASHFDLAESDKLRGICERMGVREA